MNTGKILQISSTGPNATEQIGEKIGQRVKGGEVIELISDLGGGKTTLVRGLAKGIGSLDNVASPTFTIRREYRTQDLTLYHFDFYRLNEPGAIAHDLSEVIKKPDSVVVVEWGEIVKGILPSKRLTVKIKSVSETKRQFNFSCPESLNYLLEKVRE